MTKEINHMASPSNAPSSTHSNPSEGEKSNAQSGDGFQNALATTGIQSPRVSISMSDTDSIENSNSSVEQKKSQSGNHSPVDVQGSSRERDFEDEQADRYMASQDDDESRYPFDDLPRDDEPAKPSPSTQNRGYVPEWRQSQKRPESNPSSNASSDSKVAIRESTPVPARASYQKAPIVSYEEAVLLIHGVAKTGAEYQVLAKSNKLPPGLPPFPYHTYKEKGWKGWGAFLDAPRPSQPAQSAASLNPAPSGSNSSGSNSSGSNSSFVNYEQAKELLQSAGVKSYDDFKTLSRSNKLPKGVPPFPAHIYKESGWKDWRGFLDLPPAPTRRNQSASLPSSSGPSSSNRSDQTQSNQSSPQGAESNSGRNSVSSAQVNDWEKEKQERIAKALKEKADRQARYERRKLIADELKLVKLDLVFDMLANEKGLDVYPNQDGDSSKWKIASQGNIITHGQTWQNTMTYKKGFGGISLAMMALDLEFGQALDWMVAKFGDVLDDSMKADLDALDQQEAIIFSPPDADETATGLARKYLIGKRGLPASLIDREINHGLNETGLPGGLYGAHPVDSQGRPIQTRYNVIFRGPASAEVRGIEGSDFKGCLGGSLPEHSGYRVPHAGAGEPIVAMTEAAIDALSYHTLFPGRFVISTNGSGSRFPLQYKLASEMVAREYGIRAAFDADSAGDFPAQRLCNAFILRKILAHQLKVDEDQIDEWFLNETIDFLPSESPHENSFNLGWQPELPKFELKLEKGDDGQLHQVWVDTGTFAPPCMRIAIKKDLHEKWGRTSEKVIPIGERAFAYIVNELNIRRDRPVLTKDWNEDLMELGSSYIQKYEVCAKEGFKTLPVLPAQFEAMREDTDWVFTTPPPTSSFQPRR